MDSQLPQEDRSDDVYRGFRAGLASLPIIGGAAVELFNQILSPPIQRRRDVWLSGLADRVAELERRGQVSARDLGNNEEFVSTVLQASQVALRTHQQEKIEALRNAVLNTALGQGPDDLKREMFLSLVDILTVCHLRILRTFSDEDTRGVPRFPHQLEQAVQLTIKLLPDLASQEIAGIMVEDLCRHRLVFPWTSQGVRMINNDTRLVSELGDTFIQFISDHGQL